MKYVLMVEAFLHQTGVLYGIPSRREFHEEFDVSDDAEASKKAKNILKCFKRQFPQAGSVVGAEITLTGYKANLYSTRLVSEVSAGNGKI